MKRELLLPPVSGGGGGGGGGRERGGKRENRDFFPSSLCAHQPPTAFDPRQSNRQVTAQVEFNSTVRTMQVT